TRLLAAYGLPTVPCRTVTHAAEAVAAAEALGYPVALKVDAPVILHKTDVGAVALGLANATAVRATFNRMQRELAAERVVVEPMIEPGLEALVGVVSDPQFGPLVAFGVGGVDAELHRDVAFRITPLTDRDASDLVSAVRTLPLDGWRGRPPGDRGAVHEMLLRVSAL